MENIKRASISGFAAIRGHSHDKDRDKRREMSRSSPSPGLKPANSIPRDSLELVRESPPSVFFGPSDTSSGVLLSGIFRVKVVTDPQIVLETMTLRLVARASQKRPVQKDCPRCIQQDTDIKTWNFLTESKTLKKGQHVFPYSHLIPGRLPATSHGKLAQIEYFLIAKARSITGEEMYLNEELKIVRSLAVPPEKQSLRIFPPTKLEAHLSMFPVIHPIGRFTAQFGLRNVVNRDIPKRPEIHTRWMLRKLTWRLEETERSIAPACSKHASKVGGEGKGRDWQEERVLAKDEMFDGWKKDLSGDGIFETEFTIVLAPKGEFKPRALCDVETQNGTIRITHSLVVELVVAEEWQNNTQPNKYGPTGQARVLRCQFGLKVSERAGLGISWDEEEPPLYEDMTQGPPPDYSKEFGLPPLSAQQIEEMNTRARQEAHRAREAEWPQSPPLYGVNSHMDEVNGSLEQVLEGLDLNADGATREERSFSAEDLEDRGRTRDRTWRDENEEMEEEEMQGPSEETGISFEAGTTQGGVVRPSTGDGSSAS
ncbi:MAG: hypothetical protein Q9162_004161 [Coniocarpon cinnabarinum]